MRSRLGRSFGRHCNKTCYIYNVIKSFGHKGFGELFERGRSRRVRPDLQIRCLRRLDALDQAESLMDLNVPGFDFHALHGLPKRYSIHVNGPWCMTSLNGKTTKLCGLILSNIIEVKSWLSISLSVD